MGNLLELTGPGIQLSYRANWINFEMVFVDIRIIF